MIVSDQTPEKIILNENNIPYGCKSKTELKLGLKSLYKQIN